MAAYFFFSIRKAVWCTFFMFSPMIRSFAFSLIQWLSRWTLKVYFFTLRKVDLAFFKSHFLQKYTFVVFSMGWFIITSWSLSDVIKFGTLYCLLNLKDLWCKCHHTFSNKEAQFCFLDGIINLIYVQAFYNSLYHVYFTGEALYKLQTTWTHVYYYSDLWQRKTV